jgi:HK97 family phage portal protein
MRLKFNFREGFHVEKRAIDKMALWARGDDIGTEVHAGVDVNQSNALQLTTVYACVRLLSGSIAVLPAEAFRKRGDERESVPRPPLWLEMPNPETTWFEFAERVMSSLLLDGNAFILITARDSLGFPSEIWTLHPRDVTIRWGIPTMSPQPAVVRNGQTFFVWGGDRILRRFGPTNPSGELLHIKAFNDGGLRGLSPIDVARQAIGLGLAGEKFGSKFFGRGQTMSGVIQLPASDRPKTKENIDLIKENWEAGHAGTDKAHRPGVLTGGATWQPISVPPEQAQFLETRKFQVSEICRVFGVPPHMVADVEKSTSWGTGIEQQSIGFVTYSLLPWIIRLEQSLTLLTPRGQFIKFNVKGLLRADANSEADSFVKAVTNGWMSPAEVRQLLDLPRRAGLDNFWMPANEKAVTGPAVELPPPPPEEPPVTGDAA